MALLFYLLIPAFFMIFRYELFSESISKLICESSNKKEMMRKLEKEIKKKLKN
jgi:hypothetical protein